MSGRARPGHRVDEAIAAIDVGLQTAGDASYGTTVPEGRCWRCLDREADPGSTAGVCAACREVLLADPQPDDVEADGFVTVMRTGWRTDDLLGRLLERMVIPPPSVTESTTRLIFDGQEIRVLSEPGWCVPPTPLYDVRLSGPRWYDRRGMPISIDEAEPLLSDPDYQQVAVEVMGDSVVSTVWLGLDYGFGGGPPLIFETLVIGGPLGGEQFRSSVEYQAVVGHRMMVDRVRAARENP